MDCRAMRICSIYMEELNQEPCCNKTHVLSANFAWRIQKEGSVTKCTGARTWWDYITCHLYGLEPGYEQDRGVPYEASQPDHYYHLVGMKLGLPAARLEGPADSEVAFKRNSYQSPHSHGNRHRCNKKQDDKN
jgi:hypothetical protein